MENVHQNLLNSLIEAEKLWKSADYLIYVTFPVVKDTGLLLRSLENLYKSCVLMVSVILKFEYLYKRVTLFRNPKKNLNVFFDKCSSRYGLSNKEKVFIKELLFLGKKHKESGFEFSKKDKIVILDDALKIDELTIEKIKDFLKILKKLLSKSEEKIKTGF